MLCTTHFNPQASWLQKSNGWKCRSSFPGCCCCFEHLESSCLIGPVTFLRTWSSNPENPSSKKMTNWRSPPDEKANKVWHATPMQLMQFYRTWKWNLGKKCSFLKISFSSFKLQVALLSWSPPSLSRWIHSCHKSLKPGRFHQLNQALKPGHVIVQTFLSNSSEALLTSVILKSVHFKRHDLRSKKVPYIIIHLYIYICNLRGGERKPDSPDWWHPSCDLAANGCLYSVARIPEEKDYLFFRLTNNPSSPTLLHELHDCLSWFSWCFHVSCHEFHVFFHEFLGFCHEFHAVCHEFHVFFMNFMFFSWISWFIS